MSNFEEQYLVECDNMIYTEQSSLGMWMLFYHHGILNKVWKKAVTLYRAREFPGITQIESSTGAPNPRASPGKQGVFLFRCGISYEDKEEVIKCGVNIVKKMNYTSNFYHIAFKAYHQAIEGTRAMGVRKNYLYRIAVPFPRR